MKKEELYNIKTSVYLNRTLYDEISELSERTNKGFNATMRMLLESALKDRK